MFRGVPKEARDIITTLRDAGYEAYLVGGCVRDMVMGNAPADYDIATDAIPEKVMGLFSKTVPTGIKHGTVTVIIGDSLGSSYGHYEVTTFRSDGKYKDARRPESVEFAETLLDDVSRRDFTINAMAYDPVGDEFLDPFDGLPDLEQGLIRAVGEPYERFYEDGLRPFRAIRFAARFKFKIDPDTFEAIPKVLDRVKMVSNERVRDELMKMMEAPHPSMAIELMREAELLELYLPELLEGYGMAQNRFHAYTVYEHALAACDYVSGEHPLVRFAALLHDIGKPGSRRLVKGNYTFYNHQIIGERMVRDIMERLKFSNAERDKVCHLVQHHMFGYTGEWTDAAVRRFIRKVGLEYLDELFELRNADRVATGLRTANPRYLAELRKRIEAEVEAQSAFKVTDLAIDGNDVMEHLGIGSGRVVGDALEYMLERVLDDPALNERGVLLDMLRDYS